MGVLSHVLVGGLAATGGVIAATTIMAQIKEIQTKLAVARVDGIDANVAENINIQYEAILATLENSIADAGVEGLAEEFMTYARELCLLQLPSEGQFVKVPKLRTSLKDDDDVLGTRAAQFEYFDSYYKIKGDRTDKYVAQVRILDNLHTLLLNYIDIVKKLPGEKHAIVLKHLGIALEILHVNFNLCIADDRAVSFFNTFGQTKRSILSERLVSEDKNVIQEAIAQQIQITLVQCCNQSIKNEITIASSIAEFFLRSLDKNAAETQTSIGIAKMENNIVVYEVLENLRTVSPIGNIVAHHAQQTAQFSRVKVTDQQNSFNERFNKGAFDLHSMITRSEVHERELPVFMTRRGRVPSATVDKVSKVLNYLNIAIALEEDLKNKIDSYGSKGIVSTGEFEFRRSLIESFYNQAIEDFKNIVKYDKYFIDMFNRLSNQQIIKHIQSKSNDRDKRVVINSVGENSGLREFLPNHVVKLASVIQVGVLEDIVQKNKIVTGTHADISKYLNARRNDTAPDVMPINLNSDEFLVNMAMICAYDNDINNLIRDNLLKVYNGIKNESEKEIFSKRRSALESNILDLNKIKSSINGINEILILLSGYYNIPFEKPISFDSLRNSQDFATMATCLVQFKLNLEELAVKQKFEDIKNNVITRIDSLKESLHDYARKFTQAITNDQQVLLDAEQERSRKLEQEMAQQTELHKQEITNLTGQIEMGKQLHQLEVESFEVRLSNKDVMIGNLNNAIKEYKNTNNTMQAEVESLMNENEKQIEIANKLKEINQNLEEVVKKVIERQILHINDKLIPKIKKIENLIDRVREFINEQLKSDGKITLKADAIEKFQKSISDKQSGVDAIIQDINSSLQDQIAALQSVGGDIAEKFKIATNLLQEQRNSLDLSRMQINSLKDELLHARLKIKDLEEKNRALEEKTKRKNEEQNQKIKKLEEQSRKKIKEQGEIIQLLKQQISEQTKLSEQPKPSTKFKKFSEKYDPCIKVLEKFLNGGRVTGNKKRMLENQLIEIQGIAGPNANSTVEERDKQMHIFLIKFCALCMQKQANFNSGLFMQTDTGEGLFGFLQANNAAIDIINQALGTEKNKIIEMDAGEGRYRYRDFAAKISGLLNTNKINALGNYTKNQITVHRYAAEVQREVERRLNAQKQKLG